MERVIDGKRYNTATATEICDVSGHRNGMSRSDFNYEDTRLYRTKRGRFFVAGEGGAMSRWSQPYGNNGMSSGEGLEPIDEAEARRLVERHAAAADYVALFGEPEDA